MIYFRKDDDEVIVRKLNKADAVRATELYAQIAVTKNNYIEKFTPTERCFSRQGGMFVINDLDKNKEVIDSENEVMLGGEYKGELCGLVWYSLTCNVSPYEELELSEENRHYLELIKTESAKGNLCPGREVIVVPPAKGGTMVYGLFNCMMTEYAERGIEYMTGECYRVVGYEDHEGYHECNVLNEASFKVLSNTGGIYIGDAPVRKIELDELTVHVIPLVFLWKPADAMKISKELLENKGWRKETE